MDINKILNLGGKALMIILIVVGAYLTFGVANLGNPNAWNIEDINSAGIEIVENADNERKAKEKDSFKATSELLTQEELDKKIESEGTALRDELLKEQDDQLVTTLNFTKYLLYIAIFLIVAGAILGVVLAPKKFIVGILGMIVFAVMMYLIYTSAGGDIPGFYTAREAGIALEKPDYETAYTFDNWKMASAALTGSMVLIGIAVLGIIASSVVKLLKL